MKVLITRPEEQAQNLAKQLEPLQCQAVCFPTVTIKHTAGKEEQLKIESILPKADMVIFVSANAVTAFFSIVSKKVLATTTVLAIGEATAHALEREGVTVVAKPDKASSENLLQLPLLQEVKDKQIVIFAGHAGKQLLAQQLKHRGAEVDTVALYKRFLPHYDTDVTWQENEIDVSICTSSEVLANFVTLLQQHQREGLLHKPLLVITEAMQRQARQLGFKSDIIIAESAANRHIVVALNQYDLKDK